MSDLGEIERCYTMRFKRTSKHSVARLWRAITEPDQVSGWMELPAKIDLRVGGDYYVEFPDGKGQLDGVIVRFETERSIAYVWGTSVVEWMLEADGNGCRFEFVHHCQSPGQVDDEAGIVSGWHAWLEDLDTYLDGGKIEQGSDRWAERMEAYRAELASVLD